MVKHLVKVQYAVLISSIFILSHVYLLDITQLLNKKLVETFPLPASAIIPNAKLWKRFLLLWCCALCP